ncbi:MAG TPA: nucleotidyltransferase domain-containing protein [Candidatus Tectomicrobia bacterium]
MDQDVKTAILHVLEQFPEVKLAFLFGSAAYGQLTSTSDIDVAVAADTKLPLEIRLAMAVQLSRALHREVDLIDLQNVTGEILQQSLCQGIQLLQKDAGLYARLIQRLWFDQADMMPYRRRILAERRRRFLHG